MDASRILKYQLSQGDMEAIVAALMIMDRLFLDTKMDDYPYEERLEDYRYVKPALMRLTNFDGRITRNDLVCMGIAIDFADRILCGEVRVDESAVQICNTYRFTIQKLLPIFMNADY